MSSRKNQRARQLKELATIRAIQSGVAQLAAVKAHEDLRNAQTASHLAQQKSQSAHDSWRQTLESRIDPSLTRFWMTYALTCEQNEMQSNEKAQIASRDADVKRDQWGVALANLEVAEKLARASKRERSHRQEESRQATNEARYAFKRQN